MHEGDKLPPVGSQEMVADNARFLEQFFRLEQKIIEFKALLRSISNIFGVFG